MKVERRSVSSFQKRDYEAVKKQKHTKALIRKELLLARVTLSLTAVHTPTSTQHDLVGLLAYELQRERNGTSQLSKNSTHTNGREDSTEVAFSI